MTKLPNSNSNVQNGNSNCELKGAKGQNCKFKDAKVKKSWILQKFNTCNCIPLVHTRIQRYHDHAYALNMNSLELHDWNCYSRKHYYSGVPRP